MRRLNRLIAENVKNANVSFKLHFSFGSPPNLDLNPSVDVEMREEEDGIKRNERNRV